MVGVLSKLLGRVKANDIFRIGPFNRFEKSRREELSSFNSVSIDVLVEEVTSCLNKEIQNSEFYIALVFEEHENCVSDEEVSFVNDCGINTDEAIGAVDFYDEDDELDYFVRPYECSAFEIKRVIKSKLARHLEVEPYYMAELFIIANDGSRVINLYDERGMDIVEL